MSLAPPQLHPDARSDVDSERGHIENDLLRDRWTSCCFSCNKTFVKYFTQMGFLGVLAAFSVTQLVVGAEPQSLYVGLLSSAVGITIPSPIFK